MTTRRIIPDEKSYLDNDGRGAPGPSNTAPAVPMYVKEAFLSVFFSLCVCALPTHTPQ